MGDLLGLLSIGPFSQEVSGGAMGGTGTGGLVPPNPKSRQKLSKKNGMKLVRYTF